MWAAARAAPVGLGNVVERALVLDKDGVIGLDDLPDRLRAPAQRIGNVRIELPDEGISLEKVEREPILDRAEDTRLESDTRRRVS